jgi:hypothetical protein
MNWRFSAPSHRAQQVGKCRLQHSITHLTEYKQQEPGCKQQQLPLPQNPNVNIFLFLQCKALQLFEPNYVRKVRLVPKITHPQAPSTAKQHRPEQNQIAPFCEPLTGRSRSCTTPHRTRRSELQFTSSWLFPQLYPCAHLRLTKDNNHTTQTKKKRPRRKEGGVLQKTGAPTYHSLPNSYFILCSSVRVQ